MRSTLLIVLFCLLSHVRADDSIVQISDGAIRGVVEPGYRSFKAIPFAEPPVGSLRWTDPQPNQPWAPKVLDGTSFSAGCPQACVLPPHTCPEVQSEDCLYLNVFTPSVGSSSELLPVIVFLPGGRFEQGAAGTPVYEGGFFANLTNVIMVTTNYRLGALGWAVTDVLKGNYALKDQQMALRWVQKNIQAFGGDPKRVTLGGQSAGASSTACHLVTPSSAGLFSGAFMESNPFDLPMKTTDRAMKLGAIFAKDLGCATNDFQCFQSKSADEIVSAQMISQKKIPYLHPLDLFLPWTPTVDGSFIPISPFDGIPNGNFHQVPILMGTTLDDSLLFVYEASNGTKVTETDYLALLSFLFLYDAPSVVDHYPPTPVIGDHDTRPILSYMGDHYVFFCPNRFVAESVVNIGASSPMYIYRFDHVLSFDPWGPRYAFCRGKVCHGSELPFLFHVAAPFYSFTPEEEELSRDLITYWGNFARSGNPNGNGLVTWPEYSSSAEILLLNATNSVGKNLNSQYCAFWDSIGYAWGT